MDDFSALANPEESFFRHGYEDGHQHGRLHGLIEGRAAGRQKGVELWEEVGYYRGFATLWKMVSDGPDTSVPVDSRTLHHATSLLNAIDQFPITNPKVVMSTATDGASANNEDLDIAKLLSQIRSRFKALCSTLGVSPRLRAMASGEDQWPDEGGNNPWTAGFIWTTREQAPPALEF